MSLYYRNIQLNGNFTKVLLTSSLSTSNNLKKEQILVVDDTSANLKTACDFLKEHGFEVLTAKSGAQALKFLEKASPDLILLDVLMPDMDGFETCRRLKAWEKTQDIPIIFMTAIADLANPENKVKGLTLGAVDYISKPIQLEEVLARVKTHLHLRSLTQQLQAQNIRLQQEIYHRQQAEAAIAQSERKYRELVETCQDIIWSVDDRGYFTFVNPVVQQLLGYEPEEMLDHPFTDFAAPEQVVTAREGLEYVLSGNSVFGFETKYLAKDGRPIYLLRNTIPKRDSDGRVIGATGTATDITARKHAEMLLAGQNRILEAIASDVPLQDVLEALAKLVESQSEQMWCSFHLLDDRGKLHVGAAPSLPEGYSQAVDGVAIGPNVGSCGSAVYRKETVIVDDIASDPLWADYKDLALSYGLRACWSTPILATDGTVLGTFAGYYTEPRTAADLDRDLIAQTLYLAKIAIERQRSQQALRQSSERLQLALDGSDLGLWDWNISTSEIYFDTQWKRMLGYEVDEIENTYNAWMQLIHPEDLPQVKTVLKDYLEGLSSVYEVEFRMRSKLGDWRWILSRGKVFERDEAGNPLRMAGTNKDISERKQAEEALRLSEVREREKAKQLVQTLTKLKRTQAQLIHAEKMSSLGQMVAGVAHEINNPVSFIYGNLAPTREYFQELTSLIELYQQTYPSPTPEIQTKLEEIEFDFIVEDWQKLINSLEVGAERIAQIVQSLKLFCRLDEAELKPVNIHDGIENSLLILQHRLRTQGERPEIQVIKHYAQLPLVACYASQLNQVFMNLLNNAIDALETRPSPRLITISTSIVTKESSIPNSQVVVIQIADNGTGISEEVCKHMFDPFFTTKSVGKGTGLGLAISHQIVVEKHKGQISCVSTLGQGTEFTVEIPLRQAW